MRAFAAILVLLPACYVGPIYKLKDKNLSCAVPMVERGGDLPLKVNAGEGDGLFEYDVSDWTLLDRTSGQYDLDSGQFWFINEFAPSAVRAKEFNEGTGLIQRNGDMDLGYRQTITFVTGEKAGVDVRHTRTGCAEVLRTESVQDPEHIEVTNGLWTAAGYEWTRSFVEGPAPVEGVGLMKLDRTWTESVLFDKGGVRVDWFTEGDGNGHQTRTFDDDNGFEKTAGSWQRWFDGTVAMNFTRNNSTISKQTWDFSVDAAGNGGGSWSDPDDTCDIVFNEGTCRLKSCSDTELQGTCTVPVTWPIF